MKISSALITGAASGIGRALALQLAGPGQTLHLGDRNEASLRQVAVECRSKGASVTVRIVDVADMVAMEDWLKGAGRLDLVVASAGVQFTTVFGPPEDAAQTRRIFEVNVRGVLNTALPALEVMASQSPDEKGLRGRIAVLSSLAAFAAVPGAPAYCASKAAVDAWAVGNAWAARRRGIQITSVCPGYVRTPMTAINNFPMGSLMEPPEAAARILRGIAAGRVRCAFPWRMVLAAKIGALLPAGSVAWFLARKHKRQNG